MCVRDNPKKKDGHVRSLKILVVANKVSTIEKTFPLCKSPQFPVDRQILHRAFPPRAVASLVNATSQNIQHGDSQDNQNLHLANLENDLLLRLFRADASPQVPPVQFFHPLTTWVEHLGFAGIHSGEEEVHIGAVNIRLSKASFQEAKDHESPSHPLNKG